MAGERRQPTSAIPADNEGQIKSGRLAGLSMWAAIWVLAWPTLAESFLTALVGLVDTSLAARISTDATNAIGVAAYFGWFLSLIGMAIGTGVTALVARSIGRGRLAVANACLGQGILLSAAAGAVTGVVIALFAEHLCRLLQLEDASLALAVRYLRIVAIGVPAQAVLTSAISALRGAGDAKLPLITMGSVTIINTLSSFLLSGVDATYTHLNKAGEPVQAVLLANPLDLNMGVAGIAVGTVIAWLSGAAMVLAFLLNGADGLRLRMLRLKPHLHTARRIVRIGIPNFLETTGMWLGNFLILALIGFMDNDDFYGAHIIAIRIESFSFLPGFAMGIAAATLAGQYLGARRPDLATRAILRCALLAGVMMGTLGLVFVSAPQHLTGVFTEELFHLQQVPTLLALCALFQVPFGTAMALRGAIRGAGDTTVAMTITWIGTYLIRLPLAWLFTGVEITLPDALGGITIHNPAPLQTHTDITPLQGLWIALGSEIYLRCVMFAARFMQGGWKNIRV